VPGANNLTYFAVASLIKIESYIKLKQGLKRKHLYLDKKRTLMMNWNWTIQLLKLLNQEGVTISGKGGRIMAKMTHLKMKRNTLASTWISTLNS